MHWIRLSFALIFLIVCSGSVNSQYYDYQTRGVNSQDCPEDEFQLRSLDCECSLVQPTKQPQQQQQQQQQTEEHQVRMQSQDENDNDDEETPVATTRKSTTNLKSQHVILGCVNVNDPNKLAQALRRIASANYAVASLTLENAQLRGGTRGSSSWLPANLHLDDELTIRNSTLGGDQALVDALSAVSTNSQLKRLTLNRVGLTRVPRLPAALIENLSMLNLEDNEISSLDAEDFREMPSLQALHLSRNNIDRIEPETFAKNPLLANLQLDGNELESLPAGIFRANTQLGQLSLRANRFKTLPDAAFDGLENALYHLNLAENELEVLPGAVTSRLALLEGLNIGSNRIRHLQLTPDMSHLRTLEVSNNSMTALPGGLEHMVKLEQLVSNNNRIRVIPKLPPALKNLQYVSLYQSGVEHVCPEAFQNVPSVQHIHLDGHNLSTIPRSAFAGVTPIAVSLGSNQATLVCDCRIAWLKQWIQSGVLQYPDYVICAGGSTVEEGGGGDENNMGNQPLNRIVNLNYPYASEFDDPRDVPAECRNLPYNTDGGSSNNNEEDEDTPYYPGGRDQKLQHQLHRAKPDQWPSYVHSDRQGLTTDRSIQQPHQQQTDNTYQVHLSPVASSNSEPHDDDRHEQPSINGYGHGEEPAENDGRDRDHSSSHPHGRHGRPPYDDPNELEAHRREDHDDDNRRHGSNEVVVVEDGAESWHTESVGRGRDEATQDNSLVTNRGSSPSDGHDGDDDDDDHDNHNNNSNSNSSQMGDQLRRKSEQQQQPNSAIIRGFSHLAAAIAVLMFAISKILLK